METTPRSNKKGKAVLLGLGIAGAGIAGYFGWQYLKRRKQQNSDDLYFEPNPTEVSPGGGGNTYVAPRANDNFPLKKGSRGPRVKLFQEALIAQHGSSILPKYGADGDFGSETQGALIKLGLPTTITESTMNVLVAGSAPDAEKLAADLYGAINSKNFTAALNSLNKITSTQVYSTVSAIFQEKYRIGLVRQTLVNAMLNTFTSETEKQQIRLSFSRMGLVYDGSKWSLSGLGGFSLITTSPTKVWLDAKASIDVPSLLVLGTEIERKGDYSAFENGGRMFLVRSAHVRYL